MDLPRLRGHRKEPNPMLSWAITFLIIAVIAAVLGFAGLAGTAAYLAKILFFVFLVLFFVSLIAGRRGPAASLRLLFATFVLREIARLPEKGTTTTVTIPH